jgi:hypothetical protein
VEHGDRDAGPEGARGAAGHRRAGDLRGDGEKAFVLERWRVPIPEAPDGLAALVWDEGRDTFASTTSTSVASHASTR